MKRRRTHVPGLGSYFSRGAGYWIAYYVDGREHRESVAKLLARAPGATTAELALRCLRPAASLGRHLGEGQPAG